MDTYRTTGTTSQIKVTEETLIDGVTYAPGVYRSHNMRDVLPGQPEFSVTGPWERAQDAPRWEFCANDLSTAMLMWHNAGAPTPVESVNRIG